MATRNIVTEGTPVSPIEMNKRFAAVHVVGAGAHGVAGDGTTDDRDALHTLANVTIDSEGGTIEFLEGTYLISGNLTFPAHVALRMRPGVRLKPANGVTVTINGPITAGLFQVFDVSAGGRVVFGPGVVDYVFPQWWSAVGDGVADDTAALQAAATEAREFGVPVLLPPGEYRITGRLTFWTDVICQGVIVLDSGVENAGVSLERTEEPVNLNVAELGALVKGQDKIDALAEYAGATVVFSSTEELIRRYPSEQYSPYTKNEVFQVVSEEGHIWPPLDSSYDPAKLTAWLFRPEPKMYVDGLRVLAAGPGVNNSLIEVKRSNVRLDDLYLYVPDAVRDQAYIGVDVRDAVGVHFHEPWIEGVSDALGTPDNLLGYGIHCWRTADVLVMDGTIIECRHCISGRHMKRTRVRGGYYRTAVGGSSPIDTHWGAGFDVVGAELESGDGNSPALSASGSDVSVVDSTVRGCRGIIGVRSDTPELGGYAIVRDNVILFSPSASFLYFVGTETATNNYGPFFGRPLVMPSYLEIAGNTCYNRGDVANFTFVRLFSDTTFNRVATRLLVIEANRVVEGTLPRAVSENDYLLVADAVSCDGDPEIFVRRQRFAYSSSTLRIIGQDPDGMASPFKYQVFMEECDTVGLRLQADAVRDVRLDRCAVGEIRGVSAEAQVPGGVIYLTDCALGNADAVFRVYRSSSRLALRGCRFHADMNYAVDPSGGAEHHNSRTSAVLLSLGNTAPAGADADRLPPLDDHVDMNVFLQLRSQGTITIASGATSVQVNHLIGRIPPLSSIAVTPTNDLGAASKFWVSDVTDESFKINVDVDPGAAGASFAWQVRV